ncbi:MAG: NADP-dependent oxidoreductase [Gammaproteobacteria bacterium]|nr:NADP-dependent oxidoreductase [Gammaproteobacteria bacterium]MDH5304873.1 NADP-dependent oxidoreductase [Gammaproteobacteria bacterium]MDH5323038.1 NADP-dependent oxidoreductase [Gammaproteobacteria bacterium]
MKNIQVRLASRPSGWVSRDNFTITENEVAEPGPGQVLVRNLFMSVDPYMRGRMNDVQSYIPPFQIGEVLQAGVVGEVVASNYPGVAERDYVMGMLGWENFSISDGRLLRKLPRSSAPLSWHLGILGMPGMTAYVGLMKIAAVKPSDTVFVTAAAGAVGSVVGQLARIHGCRVAGTAGTERKVALLKKEFGYDAAFNYKSSGSLAASIKQVCPAGIDVLFENVGGEIFEAALWNMRDHGRIALCGMIADYNSEEPQPGPRGMMLMIGRRLTMRGFIVTDHPEACDEYVAKAIAWVAEGKLVYRETIAVGVENAPQAFIDMLRGGNTGKQIVRLS